VLGAMVGGFIFDAAGGVGITGFNLWSVIVSVIGSVVLLLLYHAIAGGRHSHA
jgi:uncharacterized membrane protein YeaQ/YmgE (transglycosylase-associated protein family)